MYREYGSAVESQGISQCLEWLPGYPVKLNVNDITDEWMVTPHFRLDSFIPSATNGECAWPKIKVTGVR